MKTITPTPQEVGVNARCQCEIISKSDSKRKKNLFRGCCCRRNITVDDVIQKLAAEQTVSTQGGGRGEPRDQDFNSTKPVS